MLFISIFKPYKQVTSCTIARWIKFLLIRSEITGYGAYSTGSASPLAALEVGISLKDIINVPEWSNASTINKFYKNVTGSSDVSCGKTILAKSLLSHPWFLEVFIGTLSLICSHLLTLHNYDG